MTRAQRPRASRTVVSEDPQGRVGPPSRPRQPYRPWRPRRPSAVDHALGLPTPWSGRGRAETPACLSHPFKEKGRGDPSRARAQEGKEPTSHKLMCEDSNPPLSLGASTPRHPVQTTTCSGGELSGLQKQPSRYPILILVTKEFLSTHK